MAILKHAIDTYNAILAFSEKTSRAGASPLIIIVLAAMSLLTIQTIAGQGLAGDKAQQASLAQSAGGSAQVGQVNGRSESLGDKESKKFADSSTESNATGAQSTPVDTSTSPSNHSSSGNSATSDKSKSSASKESFSTKITRNGQVSAGMLIAYDASRDVKTYYGGDLLLSSQTITLSKSGTTSAGLLTVRSPDGATISTPSVVEDTDAPSSYFRLSSDSGAGSTNHQASGVVFDMSVALRNGQDDVPIGSYQLHLSASRTQTTQTADEWVYHAFVTVRVVE